VVKALFDTNILIDFLRGVPAARDELGRYADKAISVVTWMEVMVGAPPPAEQGTRAFLDGFVLINGPEW
jgi:predicted nucleic acid-binding protein